jgi:hypothetical protein
VHRHTIGAAADHPVFPIRRNDRGTAGQCGAEAVAAREGDLVRDDRQHDVLRVQGGRTGGTAG